MSKNKTLEEAIKYVDSKLEGKSEEEAKEIIDKHINAAMDRTSIHLETMMDMHMALGNSPNINPTEANKKSAIRLYNACRSLVTQYNLEN